MDAIGQNHPQLHFISLAEANIRYAMLSFYTAVTQSGRAQTEVKAQCRATQLQSYG